MEQKLTTHISLSGKMPFTQRCTQFMVISFYETSKVSWCKRSAHSRKSVVRNNLANAASTTANEIFQLHNVDKSVNIKTINCSPDSEISSQYGESNSYSALSICRNSSESFSS